MKPSQYVAYKGIASATNAIGSAPLFFLGLLAFIAISGFPAVRKPDNEQLSKAQCQFAYDWGLPTIGFCRVNGRSWQK